MDAVGIPFVCIKGHETVVPVPASIPSKCRYVLEDCGEVGCEGGHEPKSHMGRYCNADAVPVDVKIDSVTVNIEQVGLTYEGVRITEIEPSVHLELVQEPSKQAMYDRLLRFVRGESDEPWDFDRLQNGTLIIRHEESANATD